MNRCAGYLWHITCHVVTFVFYMYIYITPGNYISFVSIDQADTWVGELMRREHTWTTLSIFIATPLHWRHNDHGGVTNHQPHDCLLSRLFRRRSKKTSKLCVTGLCAGNSPGPVNSPHKWPVMRKKSPFDDVIIQSSKHEYVIVITFCYRYMHFT